MSFLVVRQAASSVPPGAATGPPTAPPPLTPEQFAALPHDSLGPRLNAVIWTLTAISAAFLALRLYCRAVIIKGLWWDDWLLIAAWVAILATCIVISITVSMGFGRHSWDIPFQDLPDIFKVYSAAATLCICASVWSKTSFALTIVRLTDGWLRRLIWVVIVLVNVFMAFTALINFIHCSPLDKVWDLTGAVPGTCWPIEVIINYDIFSAVFSGAVDIALALLPCKLIWNLQMQKGEKIGVAVAMGMGIFAGVTAFVKASNLGRMHSVDLYDSIELNYWSNAESAVTIMAASIPVLRVLIRDMKSTRDSTSSTRASGSMAVQNRRVMVSFGTNQSRPRSRPGTDGTNGSELDILEREVAPSEKGGIIQDAKSHVEASVYRDN
ncbi:hypothetical protein QBC47DRAFT_418920 [Echria macrotheca]|uniref:Rhodopsin domain-containing protein n=1 Tax=Echria macrotheca TaxID=438768 RepID=A0AAJ0B0I1_9PEZI|nr:hypothetical protein QBC47DRAFT_418920 [Echria macrotheca]